MIPSPAASAAAWSATLPPNLDEHDDRLVLMSSLTARSSLVSKVDLPHPGTLLLAASKITAAVLVDAAKGQRCDECMEILRGSVLRCSRCREDVYCGVGCQAQAWKKHHKALCRHLSSIMHKLRLLSLEEPDRLDALLLARLALGFPHLSPISQSIFLSLLPSSTLSPKAASFLSVLAPYLPSTGPAPDDILARFPRNNHVLASEDAALSPYAHVVLAEISRAVNHSCVPSAVVARTRDGVGLRTIRPVKAGDEITISYLDPLLSTPTRQKSLQSIYAFSCNCLRCTTPASRSHRAVSIPALPTSPSASISPYPFALIPTPCAPPPISEPAIQRLTSQFENHHTSGLWSAAAETGQQVLQLYWAAYGPYWPLIGVHLAQLAQIELNLAIASEGGLGCDVGWRALARAQVWAGWADAVKTVVWGEEQADLEGRDLDERIEQEIREAKGVRARRGDAC